MRLSLEDDNHRFPWRFENEEGESGVTITAREQSIPDGVVLPAGGKVFLVWEGAEVKWVWCGGFVPAVPPNALWLLEKVGSSGGAREREGEREIERERRLQTRRRVKHRDDDVVFHNRPPQQSKRRGTCRHTYSIPAM